MARHAIAVNATEGSLICSGQAQLLKGIKLKVSPGEPEPKDAWLQPLLPFDTRFHHDPAFLCDHQIRGHTELQCLLSQPDVWLSAQFQLCLHVSEREEFWRQFRGWFWDKKPTQFWG